MIERILAGDVEVPGTTVQAPDTNVIWAIIGGFIILGVIIWIINKIDKRVFVAAALVFGFIVFVMWQRGSLG
jgi:hypothetical protein